MAIARKRGSRHTAEYGRDRTSEPLRHRSRQNIRFGTSVSCATPTLAALISSFLKQLNEAGCCNGSGTRFG